jgi:hypothetical protein
VQVHLHPAAKKILLGVYFCIDHYVIILTTPLLITTRNQPQYFKLCYAAAFVIVADTVSKE